MIVSAFAVGDSDDKAKTQREKHLRPCVDAALCEHMPKGRSPHGFVGSFDPSTVIVRLI